MTTKSPVGKTPKLLVILRGNALPEKWPETFRFGNALFLAEFNILRMYFLVQTCKEKVCIYHLRRWFDAFLSWSDGDGHLFSVFRLVEVEHMWNYDMFTKRICVYDLNIGTKSSFQKTTCSTLLGRSWKTHYQKGCLFATGGFMLETTTLPKTNIAPEKKCLPKRKVVFQTSIFRYYVSFREGTSSIRVSFKTSIWIIINSITPHTSQTKRWLKIQENSLVQKMMEL